MRSHNKQFPHDDETQNVSMLYDDALPEQLTKKSAKRSLKPQVNLKSSNVVLSPYVIHLSHNEEEAVSAAPNLDALAASLQSAAQELESSPEEHNQLEVRFEDLADQLKETETHLPASSQFVIESAVETAPFQEPEAPMTLELDHTDRINVYEELLPQMERVQQAAHVNVKTPVERVTQEEAPEPAEPKTPFFERLSFPSLRMPRLANVQMRAVAAFVTLSVAVALPIHAMQGLASTDEQETEITNAGKAAIDNFLRAASALEQDKFDVASADFEAASRNFADAEASLNELSTAIATVVQIIPKTNRSYDTVSGLIEAGGSLAHAASLLAAGMEEVSKQDSTNVVTKMRQMSAYVESALPDVLAAEHALSQVDPSLVPEDQQALVTRMKETTPAVARSMQEFLTFSDTLAVIMGEGNKMRYLVAFQNNTELRPTGGFIGSFAEMDVLNGEIENVHVPPGGTYDLQGQLSAFVESPEPLSLIDPRWEFHDSNYFPDFPTSAKKMLWFYEKAGGPTVDGVLAMNATMIPDLLAILGPVQMPEYGRTIDSENFLFETQKIVEFEYELYENPDDEREEDAPKQFIGDLAPILLERIQEADTEQLLAIADLVGNSLIEKDVQLYFNDNELQSHMETIGWSGKQKQTSGDYLMVVNTNLGGGKTDTVIDQRVDVDVNISNDGRIINTVTITKEHRGIRTSLFEGLNNVDYLRLYVPRGSRLIEASGFEIPPEHLFEESDVPLYQDDDLALLEERTMVDPISQTDIWEENGKTVFGNWMQTAPGETEEVTFSYELPFVFETIKANPTLFDLAKSHLGFKQLETYTMLIQKQSGVETRNTHVHIEWPDASSVTWSSHAAGDADTFDITNDQDSFLHFLVENRP